MKLPKLYSLIIFVVLSYTGCQRQEPLTRQQWLSTTTRIYENISKEDAIAAAQKVLVLADGRDTTFFHSDDGFVASRKWLIYAVLAMAHGIDNWKIQVTEANGSSKIVVSASRQANAVTPMATSNGGWTTNSSGMPGQPINGNALYDMFFARMDFILGKTKEWRTREDQARRVKDKIVWGMTEPLTLVVDDNLPEGYVKSEEELDVIGTR